MYIRIEKSLQIVRLCLVPILIFDVALVAWSLHLMQESFEQAGVFFDYWRALAGCLMAAGALLVVYFLMNHCHELSWLRWVEEIVMKCT
jgi:uncharacterized membrane protein